MKDKVTYQRQVVKLPLLKEREVLEKRVEVTLPEETVQLVYSLRDGHPLFAYQRKGRMTTILGATIFCLQDRSLQITSLQQIDAGIKVPDFALRFQLPKSQQQWYDLLLKQFDSSTSHP